MAREAYFQLQDRLSAVATSKRWAAEDEASDELDADRSEKRDTKLLAEPLRSEWA